MKVIDVFRIGDYISVTLEGKCEELKNGSRLIDESGNIFVVLSVAMTRNNNPKDISVSTTVLMAPCSLNTGTELRIA